MIERMDGHDFVDALVLERPRQLLQVDHHVGLAGRLLVDVHEAVEFVESAAEAEFHPTTLRHARSSMQPGPTGNVPRPRHLSRLGTRRHRSHTRHRHPCKSRITASVRLTGAGAAAARPARGWPPTASEKGPRKIGAGERPPPATSKFW